MSAKETHRLMKQRMEKADEIRAMGMDPYANDFAPELTCSDFHAQYDEHDKEALSKVQLVHTVAGRLMAKNKMGKMTFLRIRDRTGVLQVMIKKDRVGEELYTHLRLLDIGDFIGTAGTPMKTQKGETTLAADGFRMLTKSLHPLPDKHAGLKDVEQRYRQRYVDLATDPDIQKIFRTRTKIVRHIQHYLDARDFIEVETPILGDVAGGAAAKPFLTHHNALKVGLQMRIATELHLKRLVVGGLERVYEIGRLFRNEGVDTTHNPEFTTIEFYQAYATYTNLMDTTEELLTSLVEELHGSTVLQYGERKVDFTRPWRRAPIAQLVQEHLGIEEDLTGIASVAKALAYTIGHTSAEDEALHICLKELSDDEAAELIPGMEPAKGEGDTIVARAKSAFASAENKEAFWQKLGENLDTAFVSLSDAGFDESTQEVTNPLIDKEKADEQGSGESGAGDLAPKADANRERRRRLALALLYAVFDHEVETTLTNPTFITDFSVSVSPLARRRDGDPAVVDRFELMVAGMELANAFSELSDPIDQRQRFEAQLRDRERGDGEAPEMDEDFLHALEIGMPPTAGQGIGIDRLVMLLTNQTSIREVILFPAMKPGAGR
ncbi:MAG: lysine--tRNA ligase [Deltaproteobacteria bacterium]|nr:lysine--tRNA ligase [Deltaproteobacteria bacterium]